MNPVEIGCGAAPVRTQRIDVGNDVLLDELGPEDQPDPAVPMSTNITTGHRLRHHPGAEDGRVAAGTGAKSCGQG